jgi:hypothetical protein
MMMFLSIFENSYVGWAVPNRFSALQILLSASSIANDMQYSHCGKLIANKLFAEEQQRLERPPKSTSCSTPFPPINITNVSPPSSHQSPMASSADPAITSVQRSSVAGHLDIPGPWDLAVREYSEWQQSNIVDETLKMEFQKACDVALDDRLDLEQVYEDQDSEFLIRSGMKRGVAASLVTLQVGPSDIRNLTARSH